MKIRWGIIAPGNIAEQFAESLKAAENTELYAVASRSTDRAKAFAEKHSVPHWYNSYEELVQNPDVDVVYIANPHPFHFQSMMLCIKHKKNIVCEKPFTVNANEAQAVIDSAKANQLFVMEAMWTRFLPVVQEIKTRIDKKQIGNILRIEADFSYRTDFNSQSNLFNPQLAGGSLLDVGVYPISFAMYVMGREPISVQSVASIGRSGVDEQAAIVLQFDSGALAICTCGIRVDGSRSARITGSKGSIVIKDNFYSTETASVIINNTEETIFHPHRSFGYEWEIESVNQCIRDKKTENEIMPLDESLRIMHLTDSIRKSWNLKYPFE